MQRREFITLLGSAAASSVCWPRAASAQTTSIFRLGTLGPRDPFDDKSPFGSILIRVLAQRGYTLGQNLAFDARGAMGDMHRVPQLLQEMKADKVRVMLVEDFRSHRFPDLIAQQTGAKAVYVPLAVDAEPGVDNYFKLFDTIVGRMAAAFK